MARTLIWHIFLLITPFVLYWVYVSFVVRKKAESGGTWDDAPLAWLLVAGMAMVTGSLFYMATIGDSGPNSANLPARMEDGKLVPGRTISPDAPSDDRAE